MVGYLSSGARAVEAGGPDGAASKTREKKRVAERSAGAGRWEPSPQPVGQPRCRAPRRVSDQAGECEVPTDLLVSLLGSGGGL